MLRSALTVGAWTAGSRLMGFARDLLIAAMAGAGPVADAFLMANKLPNLFRRLFGEGAFNAAFVPVLCELLTRDGEETARSFAEEAAAVLAFWLLVISLLGEVFMPQVLWVIAHGFLKDPAKFALTVTLARIAFPYLFLICLTALLSGVLNTLNRFVAAAAAPLVYNAFSIAAMLLLSRHVPTVGHALAIGISLSGVAQLLMLYWAVWRAGMHLHIPRPRMTPRMYLLLRRMAPGLVGAGVTQLNQTMDMFIGSMLPSGSIAYLYYADRVNQLPLGILGTAVSTALLPLLSRQIAGGNLEEARHTQNRAIEMGLILTLPAAAAFSIIADPIMQVLFVRGAFTHADATFTAQSLAAYSFGLPGFVLVKILTPGFFARGDTKTPLKLGLIVLALNFTLNLILMHPLKHVGPALATTIAAWINVGLLTAVLARRQFFQPDQELFMRVPKMLAATGFMSLGLWQARHYLVGAAGHHVSVFALAALVLIGLVLYAFPVQILGLADARLPLQKIRTRILRRR